MNDNSQNDGNFQRNHRKLKKLYSKIRKQMEFYFSDSNLVKDKFLTDLISRDPNGFVEIDEFKRFNKIKALTNNSEVIAEALSKSDLFEVSEDRKKVKRTAPLNLSKDFDACTLYVERLPPNADQKWVKDVLGQFGPITYINVPRFKATNRIKGFAFVEFENPEGVIKACEFYKVSSEKECTASEDEEKCLKIAKKHKHEEAVSEKKNKKSRIRSVSESSDKQPDSLPVKNEQNQEASEKNLDPHQKIRRKRKRCSSESEIVLKKFKESANKARSTSESKELTIENLIPSDTKSSCYSKIEQIDTKASGDSKVEQTDTKTSCDSKVEETDAKATCDSKMGESDTKVNCDSKMEQPEIKTSEPSLQTIDKMVTDQDKVEVSNTFVNGTSTEVVKTKRKRKNSKKHRAHSEKPILRVMPKTEWKAYRSKYLDLQRSTMKVLKKQILHELQEFKEQEISTKSNDVPETKKSLQFTPNIILKVKLKEPVKNPSEIKTQVKANAVVAYVDAPIESVEIFIRCHNLEDAQTILKEKKLNHLGEACLIEGEEEKKYWDKIKSDRNKKFNNPVIHKKRGRDKLLAKAAKLEEIKNKHIYFDD